MNSDGECEGVHLFKMLMAKWQNDPSPDLDSSDALSAFSSAGLDLKCEEVGDGNLNSVFVTYTSNDRNPSIILKHSPPYLKILGSGFPLSPDRLRIEYNALKKFHKLAEGQVPKVFYFDQENYSLCMEYLLGFKDLRGELMTGYFHLDVARQLGEFMARIHGGTHSSKLSTNQLRQLDQDFQNPDLMNLTKEFVFTRPFLPDDNTNANPEAIKHLLPMVHSNPQLLKAVEEMKCLFLEKKECLVHGDLHTGSVMINGTVAKILDAEFAYVGPASLDVGMLLANYLMSYYCHMSIAENNEVHRQFAYMLCEACRVTVNAYLANLDICKTWERQSYEESLLTEVAGMAGCEILRRIIGAGQIGDFQAPGVNSPHAQSDAFQCGVRLLNSYKTIQSIDRLILIALQLA